MLINFLIVLLFYITIINYLERSINNKRQENIHINTLIKQKKIITNSALSRHTTERQMPHEQLSISNILNTLEISANKTQVIIQKIAKYTYKPAALWDSYQIYLTVAGQYQYIINFINVIMQHYNFITFNEFELQKIHNSVLEDEFTVNITLTIYYNKINATIAPENLKPTSSLEKVEKPGSRGLRPEMTIMNRQLLEKNNNRISQPKNYPKNSSNLYLWSMQELQFIGSIKQHNKIIGFVTDPMGETHQITIGDKVGLKQDIITNINEKGITTNVRKINHISEKKQSI